MVDENNRLVWYNHLGGRIQALAHLDVSRQSLTKVVAKRDELLRFIDRNCAIATAWAVTALSTPIACVRRFR